MSTSLHEKFVTLNKPVVRAFEPTRPGVRSVLMSLDEGTSFESSICTEDFLRALWHFLHRTWHIRIPIPEQRVGMKTRAEQNPSEFVTPMMQKLPLPHYHALSLLVLFIRSFKNEKSRHFLCRFLAVPIVSSPEIFRLDGDSLVVLEKTLGIFMRILFCLIDIE